MTPTSRAAPYLAIENLELHKIEPSRGLRRARSMRASAARDPGPLLQRHEPELIATGRDLALPPDAGV